MRTDKWITNNEFMATYNIAKNHVSVVRNQLNPHWIRKVMLPGTKRSILQINVSFLKRAEQFRLNIDQELSDIYFEMLGHFDSDWALAQWVAPTEDTQLSWNDFIRNSIFKARQESYTLLSPKVPKRKIYFIRKCRRYLAKHGKLL